VYNEESLKATRNQNACACIKLEEKLARIANDQTVIILWKANLQHRFCSKTSSNSLKIAARLVCYAWNNLNQT
jgi:hypothetical protein